MIGTRARVAASRTAAVVAQLAGGGVEDAEVLVGDDDKVRVAVRVGALVAVVREQAANALGAGGAQHTTALALKAVGGGRVAEALAGDAAARAILEVGGARVCLRANGRTHSSRPHDPGTPACQVADALGGSCACTRGQDEDWAAVPHCVAGVDRVDVGLDGVCGVDPAQEAGVGVVAQQRAARQAGVGERLSDIGVLDLVLHT